MPVRPENLAQLDKSSIGHVALVAARFNPDYQFEALTTGKGDAAAKGAGKGALSCGGVLQGGGIGGGLWAIVLLAVFLVCLPVGATVGAIYSTSQAASAQQVEDAKAAAERGLAVLKLQESAVEAALRYGQQVGLDLGRLPQAMGPAKTEDFPSYTDAKGLVDTVIEISVLHANALTTGDRELRVSLGIQARVRVLSMQESKVIDTLTVKYMSFPRAISEWLAADGQAIKAAFDRGSASIAEQVIDEIMLIYHPQTISQQPPSKTGRGEPTTLARTNEYTNAQQPKSDKTERVPPYALRAIEPPIRNQLYRGPRRNYGSLERYPLTDLQPSFRWEAWPRGFDILPGNGSGQAQQVRYDLRIFGESEIVYERRGIVGAEHRLEQPLELCRTYRWTVRARFILNDAPRATEWTGAYDTMGGTVAPWWWRRGSGIPALAAVPGSVDSFYPIVETPSGDGKTCPDR